MRNLVLDPAKLPIRFTYDDMEYVGMPAGCAVEKNGTRIVYTAMIDTLEVKAECVAYEDFDASEWTVYFTNTGAEKTPLLHSVYAIHTVFEGENNRVYTCNGDYCCPDGYATMESKLAEGSEIRQTPSGGRSCDRAFPYQRILFDGYGHNIAVGWPGQWEASFKGTGNGVQYWATQQESRELFNISLLPGETIRTPLIVVVSFEGDLEHGINVWRRWYLKHVGTTKPHLSGSYKPHNTLEYTHATEENILQHMDKMRDAGIDLTLWWLDAGWYYAINDQGEDDWWGTLGEWTYDRERFPNGLAPIGEACRERGMDFLVWFEAERVTDRAAVVKEHPEWIIVDEHNPQVKMLDLSQRDCCDYLIKKIGNIIEESHITVYRQDYNFEPLTIWKKKDVEDRRGATENLYVQGYLRYWDYLKSRFPYLQIDSCAAGGRRNDIETMRRAVPMHQTDCQYGNLPVQQAFMQTLYSWIPYFRGFGIDWEMENGEYATEPPMDLPVPVDDFRVLLSIAPMTNFNRFVQDDVTEADIEKVKGYVALWHKVAPVLSTADFYALTAFHKSRFKWTAWQFDLPQEGRGIVEVIRNNAAPDESVTVTPRLSAGTYRFRNLCTDEEFVYEGGDLAFRQPLRSVSFWEYHKM